MTWILYIAEKGRERREFPLADGVAVRLGRTSDCDICVESRKVSRRQLSLCPSHEGVQMKVDEQASARPEIEGRPVKPGDALMLQGGAIIRFPDVTLELVCVGDESGMPDAAGPDDANDGDGDTPSMAIPSPADHEVPPDAVEGTGIYNPPPDEDFLPSHASTGSDGSPTGATHARSVTGITRAVGDAKAASVPADSVGELTGFLPEDEARRVIKRSATVSRKRWLLYGCAAMVALIGLLWLRNPDDTPATTDHEGSYFTLAYPRRWTVESIGQAIVFSPAGGQRSGVSVLRVRDDRVWRSDYDEVFRDALDRWRAAMPDADAISWDAWDAASDLPFINRAGDLGVFYVSRQGRFDQGGGAWARVFVARDQWVMMAAWSKGRSFSREIQEIIDSFSLNTEEVPPDFVRRDVRWRDVDFDLTDVDDQLREAAYLFSNRHAALGNAWRAKVKALDVLRCYAILARDEPLHEDARDVWENHLLPYARYIEDVYRRRMTDVMAALSVEDSAGIRRLADEIQTLIPDPLDPRWLWAQRKSRDARSRASGRRGLF